MRCKPVYYVFSIIICCGIILVMYLSIWRIFRTSYTAPLYTADQVYAELIRGELEAVIDSKVLPLKYYKTIKEGKEVDDEGQLGRVHQAMAYMVYAEMVMYQNDESRFFQKL